MNIILLHRQPNSITGSKLDIPNCSSVLKPKYMKENSNILEGQYTKP